MSGPCRWCTDTCCGCVAGTARRRGISPKTAGLPSSIGLAQGQSDIATVGFLLSVARSRYLDSWRRQRRLQRKLRLVWAGARASESAELSAGEVLDHLSACSDEHRVVLMLAYIDGIPVAEIAEMLGSSVSSTYSLLARARNELRNHLTGDPR